MDRSSQRKTVDIIVPCFNEEHNIDAFFRETQKVASEMEGYDFAYIFIDDGSTDETLAKIKSLAADAKAPAGAMRDAETPAARCHVRYISFSRNFGKEAAMYAGLRASKGDFAVIIDADLQHPPQLIATMLKRIEETGCDSCAARRVSRKGEPKIRSAFARAFYKIMNRYSDIEIIDGAVDFRIMNRKMVKAIVSMPESQRFSKGIFAWVGFETEWIEFENVKRLSGESKWSVWSLAKYAVDGFIDFAVSPLKFVGVFGGAITVCSTIYLIIEILKTLIFGKDTPGYASTICLILFFGGLIIAILSLIGEYIGRMYLETKGRPVYVEKESNLDEE
ncbi:MAG: glycosyltransferase family 2 protein [Bacillota bacterium]|nr:glycosyltransferase family 2 protein [Bacillota bacterium]